MWIEMNQEIQEMLEQKKELEQLKQECLSIQVDVPKWNMMDDIDIPFTL